jgi:hypothetical protein
MERLRIYAQGLIGTTSALVADDKDLLSMDESIPTGDKRFVRLGTPQAEEARRDYRGASRDQPWGFAWSALVFGLSKEAGWRWGPENRPRSATQAERRKSYRPDGVMGFVDTSLISASPSIARVQASDASIAGFGRPNNHEGAISPSWAWARTLVGHRGAVVVNTLSGVRRC